MEIKSFFWEGGNSHANEFYQIFDERIISFYMKHKWKAGKGNRVLGRYRFFTIDSSESELFTM